MGQGITVITVTIRPGMFRVGADTLKAQTFKDFEWLVVDGLYDWRKGPAAEYLKRLPFPARHIDDDKKNSPYRYNLARANNIGIKESSGELIVWLQDFIVIRPDALEKFWNLYQKNKSDIFTGVDTRFFAIGNKFNRDDPVDIFESGSWRKGETDYRNRRMENSGVWESSNPYDFEMNWAATPKRVCYELGGFCEDFDEGFGYDNTEFAYRALKQGRKLLVDSANVAEAMNHWEFFPSDHVGHVIGRNDPGVPNDDRYDDFVAGIEAGSIPLNVGCI